MDKFVLSCFALAGTAAVILTAIAYRHARSRTDASRELFSPAFRKRAAEQLRRADRRLASSGVVDRRLFQWLRDAHDYDAASSVGWLEGRLKILEQRIRRGKPVRVYVPGLSELRTLRTPEVFCTWVEDHFSGRLNSGLIPLIRFRTARADLDALGLRRRPPAEQQVELGAALARNFEKMSPPDRDREQAEIATSSMGGKILSLSGYLAETAVNRDDPAIVRIALMLHVVEDFRGDDRENIRYLVLIAHAARKLDFALGPVILSVSALGSPRAREHLQAFSRRTDEQNSLASFGVKEDGAPGEFRFVPA